VTPLAEFATSAAVNHLGRDVQHGADVRMAVFLLQGGQIKVLLLLGWLPKHLRNPEIDEFQAVLLIQNEIFGLD
jgi:hypothetical protein